MQTSVACSERCLERQDILTKCLALGVWQHSPWPSARAIEISLLTTEAPFCAGLFNFFPAIFDAQSMCNRVIVLIVVRVPCARCERPSTRQEWSVHGRCLVQNYGNGPRYSQESARSAQLDAQLGGYPILSRHHAGRFVEGGSYNRV